MKSIFVIFISLATIVVGEQEYSVPAEVDYYQEAPANPEDPASRTDSYIQNNDDDYENRVKSSDEPELLSPEAEKDLKSWVSNLDCSEALMGEVKCVIVKNLCEEYYDNPDISPTMANNGIDWLIAHLIAEGQVDPELDILIHKHFKDFE